MAEAAADPRRRVVREGLISKRVGALADIAINALNTIIVCNNTPHASRQICAPWGVTFFRGTKSALR